MKIKRFLRAFFAGVYWGWFIVLIILLFMGKTTVLGNIALILYGVNIFLDIASIIRYNALLHKYRYLYKCLESFHKERYYLCFSGTKEEVNKYTKLVEECAGTILDVSIHLTQYSRATKKQIKEVQEIVDKTKALLTTLQPPV